MAHDWTSIHGFKSPLVGRYKQQTSIVNHDEPLKATSSQYEPLGITTLRSILTSTSKKDGQQVFNRALSVCAESKSGDVHGQLKRSGDKPYAS